MFKWYIYWWNFFWFSILVKKYCEIDCESFCCGIYYDEYIKRGVKFFVLIFERFDKYFWGYFIVLLNRGYRDGG